jgi:hypothetical protein
MKYDLRISVKDYRRGKNLKIQLAQLSFSSSRQFFVKMNGSPLAVRWQAGFHHQSAYSPAQVHCKVHVPMNYTLAGSSWQRFSPASADSARL